jgi:class 3 adenylate cyclase/CHASE2 domain-containing sensor protein
LISLERRQRSANGEFFRNFKTRAALCCSGFFVFFGAVKLTPARSIPALIASGVILAVCVIRVLQFDFFERLERMTYDMRVREALKFSPPVASDLGFIAINEDSIKAVWNGSLGYKFGLYWPRQVYGRLVDELAEQGARAVALDIIFGELRPDHASVDMGDGTFPDSDEFFALQMRHASNVIIALTKEVIPPALFATNALALGDITTEKDSDGILRRVQVFRIYTNWHPAFRQAETEFGLDLNKARVEKRRIVLPQAGGTNISVPLDNEGNFDLADFVGDAIPPGMERKPKPFTKERAWHMGVVLAARELKLDLARAEVDLPHGRITLRGEGGIERVIPVDESGYFYVDWCLPPDHPQLTQERIEGLLLQNKLRLLGLSEGLSNSWRGKLAVVGSSEAIGNNLTDRGATPISKDTLLVSKHWNVANSIITGRFVQRAPLAVDLALIIILGTLTALVTWRARVLLASIMALWLFIGYAVLGVALYVQTRYWIPLVLPLLGALVMTYVCVVAWRVVFEQAERRRVKSIFGTVVSEKIMDELLQAENLSLVGARREITVLFADVRGFTELTDSSQERVAEYVRQNQLEGAAAEVCFDEQARETLETVNLYLGLVADTIIKEDATLDKFIGDCVMAFWGAPTANPRHALACVRATIDAQRAIHELNGRRAIENKQRELENLARVSAGLRPKPILPVLLLGSGINTGMATVGLMGSETKTRNYTVFGREVNLASRLEGLSGRGRIFISQTTYEHLVREDAALAATCIAQAPQKVKGISTEVKVYEVPWRPAGEPPLEEDLMPKPKAGSDSTTFTSFVQRA